MQLSATNLGKEYGLTAEEMNRVLVKQGFLQGTPGDYSPTLKGFPYVEEKNHHQGSGGYSYCNRYWTTRKFDDSIREVLDISPTLISEVRSEIEADRVARCAAQVAARKQVNADFLAKQAAEKVAQEAAEKAAQETEEFIAKWKRTGKISLVVGSVIVVGYGIYKVIPKVKLWWIRHKRGTDGENEVA